MPRTRSRRGGASGLRRRQRGRGQYRGDRSARMRSRTFATSIGYGCMSTVRTAGSRRLCPACAQPLAGLGRADSLSLDPAQVAVRAARCRLSARARRQQLAARLLAGRLPTSTWLPIATCPSLRSGTWDPELSRRFRALKIWFALEVPRRAARSSSTIEHNIALARAARARRSTRATTSSVSLRCRSASSVFATCRADTWRGERGRAECVQSRADGRRAARRQRRISRMPLLGPGLRAARLHRQSPDRARRRRAVAGRHPPGRRAGCWRADVLRLLTGARQRARS